MRLWQGALQWRRQAKDRERLARQQAGRQSKAQAGSGGQSRCKEAYACYQGRTQTAEGGCNCSPSSRVNSTGQNRAAQVLLQRLRWFDFAASALAVRRKADIGQELTVPEKRVRSYSEGSVGSCLPVMV